MSQRSCQLGARVGVKSARDQGCHLSMMHFHKVRRREFIALLVGAATAWPLAAGAQQGERMRRIGVLTNLPADDSEGKARLGAFLQGLGELGWADGRNVRI